MEPNLHIEAALRRLTHWRAAASVWSALEHLFSLLDRTRLLALYQHYFPREWATSTTSLQPDEGQLYSPREIEFAELIEARLFPLDAWLLAGASSDWEERLAFIPLLHAGVSLWTVSPDDLSLTARILASLLFGEQWGQWDELLGEAPGDAGPPPATANEYIDRRVINWERFTRLCRRAGKPLAWLPAALQVVGHNTDTVWLDADEESMWAAEVAWTIEDMDWLAAEWKAAQPFVEKWNTVHDWLEADHRRLVSVIELWNRSVE